jgi:hypothetical protein
MCLMVIEHVQRLRGSLLAMEKITESSKHNKNFARNHGTTFLGASP